MARGRHYRPSKDQRQWAAYFEGLTLPPLAPRECGDQERFASKADAKRAAAKRLRPTRCADCNGWHLTERGATAAERGR